MALPAGHVIRWIRIEGIQAFRLGVVLQVASPYSHQRFLWYVCTTVQRIPSLFSGDAEAGVQPEAGR